MARKTVEKVYSDLSEEEITNGQAALRFAFDGVSYSIDLTESERQQFEDAIKPYMAVATKDGGRRSTRSTSSASGPAAKDVRAWAVAEGYDVPARGRIPADIIEAYNDAH